jgi:hypothetical protein
LKDNWRFENMKKDGNRFYIYHPVDQEIWYEFVVPTNTWYRRDPFNQFIDNNHPYLKRGNNELTTHKNLEVTYVSSEHFDYFSTGDGAKIVRLEEIYRELAENKLSIFKEKIAPIHGKKIRFYGGMFTGIYATAGNAEIIEQNDYPNSHEIIHVLLYRYPHFAPFAEGIAQCLQEAGNRFPLTEQNCSLAAKQKVKKQGKKLWDVLSNFSANSDYHLAGSFIYFHLFVEKDTTDSFVKFLKEMKPDLDFNTVRELYKRQLGKDMQYYVNKWERWIDSIDTTSDVCVKWNGEVPQASGINRATPAKPARLKMVDGVSIAERELPTMNLAEFLPDYENRERRAWLWRLFQAAEQQAKSFAESSDRWIVLRRVVPKKQAALWIEDGTIEVDPSFDPGTLFHEIFHTAFHKSRLLAGKDEAWGEAICDTFRYMMEKQFLPQKRSDWFLKIDKYTTMSYDQIMTTTADRAHDQKYGYPASLIVRAAAKNPQEFRRLWFTLLRMREQSGVDILDNYFSYDMQNGRPY